MHLIQLTHPNHGRRVGIVEEPNITLLNPAVTSAYQLFKEIINNNKSQLFTIQALRTKEAIPYDDVYNLKNGYRVLSPLDCADPMHCVISGTGLTHKASAENRQKMNDQKQAASLTDSMKMYLMGEEGGKPAYNEIGVQPEWFYKGNGLNLKGHGDPLTVPNFANDGGEEPEIAGVYLISSQGIPHRIGFVQGNEFSDHVMEKKNYLYLAPSKLRNCSIGPELVIDGRFDSLKGRVKVSRKGNTLWSKDLQTGEEAMAHSLANLEYHHFKYDQHRIPGQLHIHFFGTGAFSFGENIVLQEGDEMSVNFDTMGRPLLNPIHINRNKEQILHVESLK